MPDALVTGLGIGGAWLLLLFVSYRLLDSALAARLSVATGQQVEQLRASLANDLERAKHSLALEQSKLSIVFEHQRASFMQLLVALHRLQREVWELYDGEEGAWGHLDGKSLRELEALIASESLYLTEDADHALRLYLRLVREFLPSYDDREDGVEDREGTGYVKELRFIERQLRAHFRSRIGLPEGQDALDTVWLLGAARLLNSYHFPETGLPSAKFKIMPGQAPEDTIDHARANLLALLEEVKAFFTYLDSGRREGVFSFAEARVSAERYVTLLERYATRAEQGTKAEV